MKLLNGKWPEPWWRQTDRWTDSSSCSGLSTSSPSSCRSCISGSVKQGLHPSPLTTSLHGRSLGLLPAGGATSHTGTRQTLSCSYSCKYLKGSPSVPLSLEQLVELRVRLTTAKPQPYISVQSQFYLCVHYF